MTPPPRIPQAGSAFLKNPRDGYVQTSTPAATTTPTVPDASPMRRFHFALAQRAYAPCDILCIGDSISEGTGATVRNRRWIDQLQTRLRQSYPTNGSTTGGEGFVKALYTTGVTFGHGWDYQGAISSNGTFGLGRSVAVLSAGATPKSDGTGTQGYLRRTVTGTSIKVLYLTNSSFGKIEIRTANAGTSGATAMATAAVASANTASSSGTTLVNGTLTYTFPSRGTYDIFISHAADNSGSVYVNGVWVYDGDENSGIRLTESAQHGSTTANWTPGATLPNGSTNQDSAATTAAYTLLNPDLVIIGLGGNDRTTNMPVATYKANLKSLIQVIKDNSTIKPSILLMGEYQEGDGTNAWPDYLKAQQSIVDADPTNVGFFSLYDRFPLASDNTLSWVYSDGVHPSDQGHATIAEFLLSGLRPR